MTTRLSNYSSVTAIASGCGACIGTLFVKLATAGSVEGGRGVRCLLLWVNISFLAGAVLFMRTSHSYLGPFCDWLSDTGICECAGDDIESCRQMQMVLRLGVAAEIVFIFLIILGFSGCADGAGRYWPLMKILMLPVLLFFLCFFPNSYFTMFQEYAGYSAAALSVFQAVILLDSTMGYNTVWFENARQGMLKHDPEESRCWQLVIVVASLTLLVGGGFLAFMSYFDFADLRVITLGTWIVSLMLLFISILECIKHGALFPSAAFVLFGQYLAWKAMSFAPVADGELPRAAGPPLYVEAGFAFVTLCWAALGEDVKEERAPATTQTVELAAAPEEEEEDAEAGKADGKAKRAKKPDAARVLMVQLPDRVEKTVDAGEFVRTCLTQAVVAAYIIALLFPFHQKHLYVSHIGALVLTLTLYGWALIAPTVCSGRRFE